MDRNTSWNRKHSLCRSRNGELHTYIYVYVATLSTLCVISICMCVHSDNINWLSSTFGLAVCWFLEIVFVYDVTVFVACKCPHPQGIYLNGYFVADTDAIYV